MNKMDTTAVCEMFETISRKLDKQTTVKSAEPIQADLTAINAITQQFEKILEEVRKPVSVKHHHIIEIASNWVFLS